MLRQISLLIMLILMMLLVACGQKGPLYLPDDQGSTTSAASDVQ